MPTQKRRPVFDDYHRGTGRTQRMLQLVVESIQEGKSPIRVYGYSHHYSIELMKRLLHMLNEKSITVARSSTDGRIELETGGRIEFHSMQKDMRGYNLGVREVTEFYDHFRGNR